MELSCHESLKKGRLSMTFRDSSSECRNYGFHSSVDAVIHFGGNLILFLNQITILVSFACAVLILCPI